jgi:hypothetical protein
LTVRFSLDIVVIMKFKKCISCGEEKILDEYYKHSQMKDGRLNKCKDCCKQDNRKNRVDNIDYYREYDRMRSVNSDRVEARKQYEEDHKDQVDRTKSEWRKRNKDKSRAHRKVAYEIKKGSLSTRPCEICGNDRTEAHHEDYSKPLDIVWLCDTCHKQRHKDLKEIERKFPGHGKRR